MTRITFAIATVLSLAFTPLAAQDFQKGYDAAQAGDFATALQEWTPLAEAGDAQAQYNLGLMYKRGFGVLQDYAEAVRWYRLARLDPLTNVRQHSVSKRAGLSLWLPSTSSSHPKELSLAKL